MTTQQNRVWMLSAPMFFMLALLLSTVCAQAQPFAYVGTANGFRVIDTATDAVVASGAAGGGGIAITPDGTRAYMASGGNTVVVVATDTNMVIATVPVGNGPFTLGITPDGTRALVITQTGGAVSVIDTDPLSPTYNTVVRTVTVGNTPAQVAFTIDGAFAWVTNYGSASISVINTQTFAVETVLLPPSNPHGIAITPDGTRAYVAANTSAGTFMVFNTATRAVIATPPGGHGTSVAITPDGTRAYIVNDTGCTGAGVSVVDTDPRSPTYNTVIRVVQDGIGSRPHGIGITGDGTKAYVAARESNFVSVIDTDPISSTYHTVVKIISLGAPAGWVAITPF